LWQFSQAAVVAMCVAGLPSAATPLWQLAQPLVIPAWLNFPPAPFVEFVVVAATLGEATGVPTAAFGVSFWAKFATEFVVGATADAAGTVAVVAAAMGVAVADVAGAGVVEVVASADVAVFAAGTSVVAAAGAVGAVGAAA
jgi:hypothetical protein